MFLRKLFIPACLVVALTVACGTPATSAAVEESVGFDANAKPAACSAQKTECSAAKQAECAAKQAECKAKQAECEAEANGSSNDG